MCEVRSAEGEQLKGNLIVYCEFIIRNPQRLLNFKINIGENSVLCLPNSIKLENEIYAMKSDPKLAMLIRMLKTPNAPAAYVSVNMSCNRHA